LAGAFFVARHAEGPGVPLGFFASAVLENHKSHFRTLKNGIIWARFANVSAKWHWDAYLRFFKVPPESSDTKSEARNPLDRFAGLWRFFNNTEKTHV